MKDLTKIFIEVDENEIDQTSIENKVNFKKKKEMLFHS